jgi:DNA-directed RNA polymerase specialized sigma24 family protein
MLVAMISPDKRSQLAQYCSQNPYDSEAFERLCVAIRPIAYSVMKLHRNVIPYYDKEDYLQEAYITLYHVLKRVESKPDIVNSFQAYLWQSIKNTYCGLFRDYVLHHLIEIRSYESRENGFTYSQMVYFQEYADSYYSKKRESSKRYYWANRLTILEKQRKNRKEIL